MSGRMKIKYVVLLCLVIAFVSHLNGYAAGREDADVLDIDR